MANEPVQKGTVFDGNGILLLCQPFENPTRPTIAELTASSAVRITYGTATDGFAHNTSFASVTTGRWGLKQVLTLEGQRTDDLTIKYVYNRAEPTEVETALGTPGVEYDVVKIVGYPNDHVIDEDTKINAIIPIRTASATDVPEAANTEVMKQMIPEIRAEVITEERIQVVAGGSGD